MQERLETLIPLALHQGYKRREELRQFIV